MKKYAVINMLPAFTALVEVEPKEIDESVMDMLGHLKGRWFKIKKLVDTHIYKNTLIAYNPFDWDVRADEYRLQLDNLIEKYSLRKMPVRFSAEVERLRKQFLVYKYDINTLDFKNNDSILYFTSELYLETKSIEKEYLGHISEIPATIENRIKHKHIASVVNSYPTFNLVEFESDADAKLWYELDTLVFGKDEMERAEYDLRVFMYGQEKANKEYVKPEYLERLKENE